jgi:hypothetical protein
MPTLLNAEICMFVNSPLSSAIRPLALRLEVVLLASHALRLALANNLLAQPLSREALLQQLQVLNNVSAALDDGILGCDCAVGRDAQLKGREERVRDFVCGEDNVVVLEQALREEVAERVVFLVEGEDGRVGDTWCTVRSVDAHGGNMEPLTGLLLVLDLGLAIVEQEELESVGIIVSFIFT